MCFREMAFWRRVWLWDSSDEKTRGSKTTRVFSQLCQKSGQMGIKLLVLALWCWTTKLCGCCSGYLLTWHPLGSPSPPRPDSGCSCELGACCCPHGQVWEMPGGLAGFSVAFGSSLSHMVLKCQTVPKCGPRLRRLDRENTLQIKDLLSLFIPQPLASSLGCLNEHLLSNLWLIVSYLYLGR